MLDRESDAYKQLYRQRSATERINSQAVNLGVEEIQLYRLKVEAYGDYQGPIKKFKQIHPDDCPPLEEQILALPR